MARTHGLGEFDERLTLEAPYGARFHIYRRGDTYDEDGGRNRHGWHWRVTMAGMEVDRDTYHGFTGWTDGYGLRHDGFPTREDAYDHMSRHCRTPKEYADTIGDMEERSRGFLDSIMDGTFDTGMHGD